MKCSKSQQFNPFRNVLMIELWIELWSPLPAGCSAAWLVGCLAAWLPGWCRMAPLAGTGWVLPAGAAWCRPQAGRLPVRQWRCPPGLPPNPTGPCRGPLLRLGEMPALGLHEGSQPSRHVAHPFLQPLWARPQRSLPEPGQMLIPRPAACYLAPTGLSVGG